MGTIIRLCDWYGVDQLICSKDTVDCYNPKVVQATMGSLSNIQIVYTNLSDYLSQIDIPIYGTLLEGKNINSIDLPTEAVIIIGNEGNGISDKIMQYIEYKITIPKHPKAHAESLNAAIATSIIIEKFMKYD